METALRSVQTMQLCSLGQGTVSPWSIVPSCLRVLLELPTMSDSYDSESWDTWELSDIVGGTSNTLRQRGCSTETLFLVPKRKVASSGPTLKMSDERADFVSTNRPTHGWAYKFINYRRRNWN